MSIVQDRDLTAEEQGHARRVERFAAEHLTRTSRNFEELALPPSFQASIFRAIAARAEQLAVAADHRAAHPLHRRVGADAQAGG